MKITQLTRDDVAKLRARGEYAAISTALASGQLAEITGQPVPDAEEPDDAEGEHNLAWLKRAYERRDYAAINAAAQSGKLNSVLKGSNNND
jgi:hypothetical protein